MIHSLLLSPRSLSPKPGDVWLDTLDLSTIQQDWQHARVKPICG